MNFLRANTQVKVRLGPAVAFDDGVTPDTSVLLSAADEAYVLKADGASPVDISSLTWAAVSSVPGWYDLTLRTSEVDTPGELRVVVQDVDLIVPIFDSFQVVSESVYDKLFANNASLNDLNTSDVFSMLEAYDPPTKTEMDAAFAALNDVSTSDVGIVVQERLDNFTASVDTSEIGLVVEEKIAVYDAPTKSEMDAGFAALNDASTSDIGLVVEEKLSAYDPPTRTEATADKDEVLAALLGTSDVKSMVDLGLSDYDAPTKAELDAGFAALNDASTSEIGIVVEEKLSVLNDISTSDVGVVVQERLDNFNATVDTSEVASAVWDIYLADHLNTGSAGEALNAAGSAGDPWVTNLPGAYGVGSAGYIVGNLNNLGTSDIHAQSFLALLDYDPPTKTELDAAFAAMNNISTSDVGLVTVEKLAVYDAPTKTEMDAAFAALNDVSTSQVGTIVNEKLVTYDPPTRTEATADKDEIIALVNNLDTSGVYAEATRALNDYDGPTKTEMDAAFAALNDISTSQIGIVVEQRLSLLNNLSQAEAQVAALAALVAYDPPTKAELDSAQTSIQSAISSLNNIGTSDVRTQVDGSLAAYDAPTKSEMDAGFAALNDMSTSQLGEIVDERLNTLNDMSTSQVGAVVAERMATLNDVSTSDLNQALEAYDAATGADLDLLNDIGTSALNEALNAYDVPTRSELTDDKNEVLASIAALLDVSTSDIGVAVETIVENLLSGTPRLELVGVPAADGSIVDKLDWVFMHARNLMTVSTSEQKIYGDDGVTVVGTASVLNTSGLLTRSEYT